MIASIEVEYEYDTRTAPSEWDVKRWLVLSMTHKLLRLDGTLNEVSPEHDTRTAPSKWDVKL
jgi:hypothetical protein